MITIERNGEKAGTIELVNGELKPKGVGLADLIEGKRSLGFSDEEIYNFLAQGGVDNGYLRSYESSAAK